LIPDAFSSALLGHAFPLQQVPAKERAQAKANRIENAVITRHLLKIHEGVERVLADRPTACERHPENHADTPNEQYAPANPASSQPNTKSYKRDGALANHHQAYSREFQFWPDKKRKAQETRADNSARQCNSD
jgi:hypothetical protein